MGQGGNAPLRLRLTAHPPSGLRCPHRTARAEARLCSATAALPRSGKDRSGERLAPAGAVSEANRAAGPALRPEIGRSYAFYRRTGDNKRSDGRLPYEKQLSPPQAALDSAAPCRGAFQAVVTRKASPARGGAAAGGGGVRRLALPLSFRAAAAPAQGPILCIGPQVCAIARPTGRCKHRPLRTQGKALPGFGRCAAPPQVPQRKNSPAPGLWVRGCFAGMRAGRLGGQRPADSGVPVSETAASGVAGRALAEASSSSPRRHSRCSSSGICSATQVPSSCCVIPSSISG